MKKRNACDKLTIYETTSPLYSFAGGWFYGAVPLETQIKIDRAILNLRLQDKIRQIIDEKIDSEMPPNCASISTDIPPGVLGWLLLCVVGIFMIPVIASFGIAFIIRRRNRRQNLNLANQDDVQET